MNLLGTSCNEGSTARPRNHCLSKKIRMNTMKTRRVPWVLLISLVFLRESIVGTLASTLLLHSGSPSWQQTNSLSYCSNVEYRLSDLNVKTPLVKGKLPKSSKSPTMK